jgi:hypothetical protein
MAVPIANRSDSFEKVPWQEMSEKLIHFGSSDTFQKIDSFKKNADKVKSKASHHLNRKPKTKYKSLHVHGTYVGLRDFFAHNKYMHAVNRNKQQMLKKQTNKKAGPHRRNSNTDIVKRPASPPRTPSTAQRV